MTSITDPINKVECWYLPVGYDLYGALTQSQVPFLCLLKPHESFKAYCSEDLPPNITTIPVALPAEQSAAE
jgi:hypothetical protein